MHPLVLPLVIISQYLLLLLLLLFLLVLTGVLDKLIQVKEIRRPAKRRESPLANAAYGAELRQEKEEKKADEKRRKLGRGLALWYANGVAMLTG